jgi:tetratricopeptide (TPR) repeat protein
MRINVADNLAARAEGLLAFVQKASSAGDVLRVAVEVGLEGLKQQRDEAVDDLCARARTHLREANFVAAGVAFDEARRLRADDASLAFESGCAWALAQRIHESQVAFTACLAMEPNHYGARRQRAFFEAGLHQFQAAEVTFSELLDLRPSDVGARLGRADCRTELGLYAEAVEDFDAVLNARPKHPGATRGKARALLEAGDYGAAGPMWKEVVVRNPDDAVAVANHDRSVLGLRGESPFGEGLSDDRARQRERDARCIQWNHRERNVACDNPFCPARTSVELGAFDAISEMVSGATEKT